MYAIKVGITCLARAVFTLLSVYIRYKFIGI